MSAMVFVREDGVSGATTTLFKSIALTDGSSECLDQARAWCAWSQASHVDRGGMQTERRHAAEQLSWADR